MPLHLPPTSFTLGFPVASKYHHFTCLRLLRVLAPLLIKCLSCSAKSICLHLSCGQGSLLGFPLPSSKPLRTCWQNAWMKPVVTLSDRTGNTFLCKQTLVRLYITIRADRDMKASGEGNHFIFSTSANICVLFIFSLRSVAMYQEQTPLKGTVYAYSHGL